jgi:hypothetical protein
MTTVKCGKGWLGTMRGATSVAGARPVSGLLRDALLFWPLLNLLVSVAALSVGGAIAAWQLPVTVVAALAAAAARPGFSWANTLLAGLLMAALVVVAAHLSIWMIDQSWDSRAYHGPAVIALREGWNPAYVTHSCDWRADFCAQLFATAIDHYPKAAWYGGAQFYALWGDIDAAKTPNLLMLVLVFLVAHHCVSRWLPGQTACIWLSTFVLAGCPVLLTQLFSGYIDGLMAAALTCQILLLADFLLLQERGSLWRAAVMLPYLANLKLTGLVYGLLFIALAALYLLVRARHQLLPFFKWQAAAVILALLLGFNPYGTNLRDHGNPFYPAYQSASSVIDQQAAPWFMAKNRVSQFLIATFSVQNGPLWWEPVLAAPLTHPMHSPSVETRFGAFGPLFSAIILFAALLLPLLRRDIFGVLALAVLLSIFITSAAWWARLAPQAWLAVALVPLGICRLYREGWRHELACALLLVMAANNMLVMRSAYYVQYRAASQLHADLYKAKSGAFRVAPVTLWQGGDFGMYNRHKLAGVLQDFNASPEGCASSKDNRIFVICR